LPGLSARIASSAKIVPLFLLMIFIKARDFEIRMGAE
jgi:hypothetical protein